MIVTTRPSSDRSSRTPAVLSLPLIGFVCAHAAGPACTHRQYVEFYQLDRAHSGPNPTTYEYQVYGSGRYLVKRFTQKLIDALATHSPAWCLHVGCFIEMSIYVNRIYHESAAHGHPASVPVWCAHYSRAVAAARGTKLRPSSASNAGMAKRPSGSPAGRPIICALLTHGNKTVIMNQS